MGLPFLNVDPEPGADTCANGGHELMDGHDGSAMGGGDELCNDAEADDTVGRGERVE